MITPSERLRQFLPVSLITLTKCILADNIKHFPGLILFCNSNFILIFFVPG